MVRLCYNGREVKPVKRLLCLCLCLCLCSCLWFLPLSGCKNTEKFESSRYDLFDTEIRLIACCGDQATMDAMADIAFGRLEELHQLFDIYHHYDGIINLYDINCSGGQTVTAVDADLMTLLAFGKEVYTITSGRVNIAMGTVLALWHDARDTGVLPEDAALRKAAQHCDIANLVLDTKADSVMLLDPGLRLDVGAIAKGWAAGQAAQALRDAGYADFVLSAGGNVVTAGSNGGKPWKVGIEDPDEPDALCDVVEVSDLCVVTSGGYQRYVEIDGKRYHHIIDPDTLYPGDYVRSASVICADSALADALSTACFLLTPEEGMQMAKENNARLILVDKTGKLLDSANDPS